MNKKIGILDYGIGNIRSVSNAVSHVGFEPELLTSPGDIKGYQHIIVPGVGNFGHAVEEFARFEFGEAMQDYIISGGNCLGICVGMQMLFDMSEESPDVKGLGLISGNVVKMTNQVKGSERKLKLPHIGWSALHLETRSTLAQKLLRDVDAHSPFYFVHSYTAQPLSNENLNATVAYGENRIAAMVSNENVIGTQFHPERSGLSGLKIIQNFCELP
ncbi:MAG: imidazole glycerol phosphate synthase subunit HisH [Arenicella sp.]